MHILVRRGVKNIQGKDFLNQCMNRNSWQGKKLFNPLQNFLNGSILHDKHQSKFCLGKNSLELRFRMDNNWVILEYPKLNPNL